MANRLLPANVLRVLNDFSDSTDRCVTRNLKEGGAPGIWQLLQSTFPPSGITPHQVPIKISFELANNIDGHVPLMPQGVFNMGSMIIVLGLIPASFSINRWPREDSWVGVQYTLNPKQGVIIFYKNVWDAGWGRHFQD